jgi:hypothetical protein
MSDRDRRFDADLDALTIARLRTLLLGPGAAAWARRYRDALPSEAAAVVKIMTNEELSAVAGSLFNFFDRLPVASASVHADPLAAPSHTVLAGGLRVGP